MGARLEMTTAACECGFCLPPFVWLLRKKQWGNGKESQYFE